MGDSGCAGAPFRADTNRITHAETGRARRRAAATARSSVLADFDNKTGDAVWTSQNRIQKLTEKLGQTEEVYYLSHADIQEANARSLAARIRGRQTGPP